jgi:hypothetical protein
MKSRNLSVSTQSHCSLSQTSLGWTLFVKQLDRLWQFLTEFARISQGLKVTWKRDRRGRMYLEIYDFSTEKHYRFDSEQDARIWIDCDRYQQREPRRNYLRKH